MPNWCGGYVSVKGKPKDIENFCKLFIFEEDIGTKKGKYFARSFTHEKFKDFKKEYLEKADRKDWDIGFPVDFAWSCWSCIFEGYPNNKECVTLEWAMKKYNVKVEIETEEDGMGFEEKVITKNGKPVHTSFNMPEHKCNNCGKTQIISSNRDLEDTECHNCGKIAWKDELTELIKEKLKKINKENKK